MTDLDHLRRKAAGLPIELHDDGRTCHAFPVDDYDPNAPTADEVAISAPCPECGQVGACAYDTEGRPLIHATNTEEDA